MQTAVSILSIWLKRHEKLKLCQLTEVDKFFYAFLFPSSPTFAYSICFLKSLLQNYSYNLLSRKEVLLTLVHLVVHPMVKLIALLGVSQRLQASQNIPGKKKFITKLEFFISNPAVSNLWNYMINSFAESASVGVCNPTGSY